MSYVIPDPRFEMPELFEPGRKPIGAVEIDTDYSLAPTYAFLMRVMKDEISGRFPEDYTLYNSAVQADSIKLGTLSSSIRFRGPSDYTDGYQFPSATYTVISLVTIPPNGIRRPVYLKLIIVL